MEKTLNFQKYVRLNVLLNMMQKLHVPNLSLLHLLSCPNSLNKIQFALQYYYLYHHTFLKIIIYSFGCTLYLIYGRNTQFNSMNVVIFLDFKYYFN